jgi:peptidoglycan/LPS O-acetylase OafA/YrhL
VKTSEAVSARIVELDGIRGLAAVLVLVFHVLAAGRVSGGVDVLIFLSGFFFSTILLKDSSSVFPRRLINYLSRLTPVAVLVLGVVMFLALVDLAPRPTRTLMEEIFFSALMAENWFLGNQSTDYLANDGWQSLVQHFWAVSIQVQLFALFLLVTHFVKMWGKSSWIQWQWGALCALSGLSLVYSAWVSYSNPTFAYFDTIARAWEFGFGAMVGLMGFALPRWINNVRFPFVSLGVLLIVATGVFVPPQGFPFPSALVPIAGITLFSLGVMCHRDSSVRKIFRTPPARFVGSLSYPIYLWHWPIHLIVSDYLSTAEDTFIIRLVVVSLVTLGLSWVTAELFERPILAAVRSRTIKKRSFVTVITVGSLALSSLGVSSVVQARDQTRFRAILNPNESSAPVNPIESSAPVNPIESFAQVKKVNPVPYRDGCHLRFAETKIPTCVYGDITGARTVLLLGGSHAASWQPALDKAALEMGWRLLYTTKSACRLTFGPFGSPIPSACEEWNKNAVKLIIRERPDLVVSTSTVTAKDGTEEIPKGYLNAWTEFSTYGIDFLMIRDVPHWENDPVDCVERFPERASDICAMKASERMASEDPTRAIQDQFPNFTFVDFTDAVCPEGVCLATDHAAFTYRDTQHLTKDFSERLFFLFLPELEKPRGEQDE